VFPDAFVQLVNAVQVVPVLAFGGLLVQA